MWKPQTTEDEADAATRCANRASNRSDVSEGDKTALVRRDLIEDVAQQASSQETIRPTTTRGPNVLVGRGFRKANRPSVIGRAITLGPNRASLSFKAAVVI